MNLLSFPAVDLNPWAARGTVYFFSSESGFGFILHQDVVLDESPDLSASSFLSSEIRILLCARLWAAKRTSKAGVVSAELASSFHSLIPQQTDTSIKYTA